MEDLRKVEGIGVKDYIGLEGMGDEEAEKLGFCLREEEGLAAFLVVVGSWLLLSSSSTEGLKSCRSSSRMRSMGLARKMATSPERVMKNLSAREP